MHPELLAPEETQMLWKDPLTMKPRKSNNVRMQNADTKIVRN
jgi:hypothetical protein